MGFGNFLGSVLKHTGRGLRTIADVGGHVLRRFGQPIAHALKPLAHTIHSFLPSNSTTSALGTAMHGGLNYVADGHAANHVQHNVGGLGDRLASLGRKLHSD